MPKELRALARSNQKVVYSTLMQEAASALQKLAADPRYLDARPGMLAVLHTWTRDMLYHPHVHMLVTGGGLDHQDGSWIPSRNPAFLLPARALSVIFRAMVRDALQKKELIAGIPARTWRRRWVVHCQHAGTGEKVLEYLGRYIHRVAIANSRIESFDGEHVVFRYRENRSGEMKRCRVDATEFVRRFLQHVLPRRFVKVRSYGLFSSSCRAALDLARQHLAPATGAPSSQSSGSDAPRDEHKEITERTCPHCYVGRMRIVAELLPSFTAGAPLNIRAPP